MPAAAITAIQLAMAKSASPAYITTPICQGQNSRSPMPWPSLLVRRPEAKVPKQVTFVEDITKNERGKVDRNAMKALWVRSQDARRQK